MITLAEMCGVQESDDIGGEVLSERDLVDADGLDFALPDGVDQEWLLGELWKDLLRGEHAKEILAESEMRRIIEVNRSMEHQLIDGIGQLRCRVSLDTYLHWTSRYGADFWKQEENLQFFAKRNPGFLVDNFHKKSMQVVDGFRDRTLSAPAESLGGQLLPVAVASGQPGDHGGEKRAGAGVKTTPAPASPRGRGRGRGRWAKA